jgi:predicted Zn-dependent protease
MPVPPESPRLAPIRRQPAAPARPCTTIPLVLALVFAGCATTNVEPIRGDHRLLETDEELLWKEADELDALLAGSEALYTDAALEAHLDAVAQRLLPHMDAQGAKIRIKVVKDPFLNAFALANGSLYLHSGILAQAGNEAQVAMVIGHELAHYLRRHSLREQREADNQLAMRRVVVALLALGAATGGSTQLVMQILELGGAASERAVARQIQGYARDLEREADEQGLRAVAAAGYDTREAAEVFEKLHTEAAKDEFGEPYFFGSHPSLEERIANTRAIRAMMPESTGGRVGAREHDEAVANLLLDNATIDLRIGRPNRALGAVERHLAIAPDSARAWFLLGEVRRRLGDDPATLATAREAYRVATVRDPDHAAAHRELGLAARALGDRETARSALERFLTLDPDAADRMIIESYIAEVE